MPRQKFKWNISAEKLRVPLILALIVVFALFLRVYWGLEPSIQNGYAVSGGSDSYYHERIIGYILSHKHQLIRDPMLNYPGGSTNPRPPLFHWAIVLMGYVFAPFIGEYHGAILSLILFPAIFSSLSVIVVYLLAKEAFNRKVGLMAALFMAIMPGALTRGVVTQADWDAFDLFFILLIFYFFLMALKKMHYRMWIKDWTKKDQIKEGLGLFVKENKLSMIYASLSGMSMAALALAWKGYTYGLVILLIYLFIQILINRFRNRSNLHMAVFLFLFMVIGFGLSFPWYYVTHRIPVWFDVPFMLTAGVFGVALFMEVTNKYPWPLVFSVAALILAGAGLLIATFFPTTWSWIVSGQGYFVKNKLYSTIAEAQPATLGYIAMSAGVGIFILTFLGLAEMVYMLRKKTKDYFIFFVLYSLIAIYMALSAARFIYNASPAFAIAGAIGLVWILDALHFRDTFEELKKFRGGFKKRFKAGFKVSQVIVALMIAFLLVVPTVWSAVDAGIPYEEKKKFDKQIYNTLPSFMKPNETAYNKSAPWYLGAFGYSLPKSDYPWERAWRWLREQDNSTPPEYRPGFISWWDYGFEGIQKGQHPVVADNFQDGYRVAAQMLLAQNESQEIALFVIRLMDGDYAHHNHNFSDGMIKILHEYFTDGEVEKIKEAFSDPAKFTDTVLNDPDYYGRFSKDISPENVKYVYLMGMFSHHSQGFLVNLYDSVRNYTHTDLRYFAVDYRLFPFSGRNTGIFYAPAKLGDRRIHQYGGTVVPYDFYDLKAVDEYGNEYELDKVPANVHIVNYKIIYKPMFYDSMLYRAFIGYSGEEVGIGNGIPGISPGLYNYNPMQAWNLTHFKLVYRTAYWNPYKDYQNHTDAWEPIPVELAVKYQREHKGTVELNPPAYRVLPNDVVMIKFYEGAIIEGHVKLSTGEPLKHIRITLLDEYGIPHESVFTNSTGYFKLYAVAGNLTLVASTNGKLNKIMQIEQTRLYVGHVNVSEAQAERLVPNIVIQKNIVVKPSNLDGMVYFDVNHDNKYDSGDVKVNSGAVILENKTYDFRAEGKIVNGLYHINDLPPHTYTVSLILNGRYFYDFENLTMSSGVNLTKDLRVPPSYIYGNVTYSDGTPARNATVELNGIYSNYTVTTNSTGAFRVLVVPDNYTVVAHVGSYVSSKNTVIINLWNYSTSVNLTLRHAFKLSGRLIFNGQLVPDVYIKISSDLRPYDNYILKTGGDGSFSVMLPGGFYTVYTTTYVGNERTCYLNFINLDRNLSLSMNLEKAYRLYGYVGPDKVKNPEINAYEQNGVFYRAYANGTGYYEMFLPAGKYILGAVGFDTNRTPYFARTIVDLHTDLNVSLTMQKAYNVTGYVYYDMNGNGRMDPNETLRNGLVYFYDSQGIFEIRNIPPDGRFVMPTTINYNIKVKLWGYTMVGISGRNPYYISVVPNKVNLYGHLYRYGKLNTLPVDLVFENNNVTYRVNNVTSSYAIALPPGTYTVSMVGFNRSYELENKTVTVNLGYAAQSFNISFRAYAHVTVISQATGVTWYHNGNNYTTGKIVKLPVGNYTLYAYNSSYAALMAVSITQNATIEVPLEQSYFVYPKLSNTTENLKVHIREGNISLSLTGGVIRLPAGTYNFSAEEMKLENGTYYVYYGYNTSTITTDTVVNLWINKKMLLTSVSGVLDADGVRVANTQVTFVALDKGKMNVTVSTDSTGAFNARITPGNYMVYTYYIEGAKKYANISKVKITGSEMFLKIQMENAYMVSGMTYLHNSKVNTTVVFHTEFGELKVRSNGYYWIILPEGIYNVSAEVIRTEYGEYVQYFYRGNVTVNGTVSYDLHLIRNTYNQLSIHVVSVDTYARPNSTIGVTLSVKNVGNIEEKIKFEGVNGWNVQDSKEITLLPGKSTMVSLVIHVPVSAPYGETTFQVRALFSGYASTVDVKTNVTAIYNTEIKETKMNWENSSLVYDVEIVNNGNRWVNYTISVLNRVDLLSKGWDVKVYMQGSPINWINVSAGKRVTVQVIAHALRGHPSTIEPIILSVYGGTEHVVKYNLNYPELSSSTLYVKGENVENYTGTQIPQYFYWVWGVTIALAVAIGIIGRKRK
ncbi:MAG: peptide transporter [Euryarchaeota archaeon]|nr:peptide transporter [Euryarchaeota archaeon]